MSHPRLQRLLLAWYGRCGRAHLPWRKTRDPYRVLVSELMLQQTQVDRALQAFEAFVHRFPSLESLATASTADVVRMWKGLGYNTRAVRLKLLARTVMERFGGVVPSDEASLRSLPGVGPYTAAAVRAFAFDLDDAAIDTNVHRVVHRWLYGLEHPPSASARTLDADARALVPKGRGHAWNSGLMDLGAAICTARAPKCSICPIRTACAAAPIDAASLDAARRRHSRRRAPQEVVPFERSTRYVRGRIVDRLRALPPGQRVSLLDLHHELEPQLGERSIGEFGIVVESLVRDGLVAKSGAGLALRD